MEARSAVFPEQTLEGIASLCEGNNHIACAGGLGLFHENQISLVNADIHHGIAVGFEKEAFSVNPFFGNGKVACDVFLLLVGRSADDHTHKRDPAEVATHLFLQWRVQCLLARIGNKSTLFKLQYVSVRRGLDHTHVIHDVGKSGGSTVILSRVLLDKLCELIQFFFTHDSHNDTSNLY